MADVMFHAGDAVCYILLLESTPLIPDACKRLRICSEFSREGCHPETERRFVTINIALLLAIALSIGPATSLILAQDYPADVSRGKAIYERHCMTCHGARGYGDGPNALLLTITPANFHRPGSFLKSDETLLRMIEHGGVFSPMHSWRGRLTDGEMQDVLAYVRLLSQQ
jgi:hypothetical protein